MNTKPNNYTNTLLHEEKLLSDNRELYISQSTATKNGIVAPLPRAATRKLKGTVYHPTKKVLESSTIS